MMIPGATALRGTVAIVVSFPETLLEKWGSTMNPLELSMTHEIPLCINCNILKNCFMTQLLRLMFLRPFNLDRNCWPICRY
jgi:hypothetical protein